MVQGVYIAAAGMTAMMQKQDQIANNLANINTTGFKQSSSFTKTLQKYLDNDARQPNVNREIATDKVFIDYSQGPAQPTNNVLDAMIEGTGFFNVLTNSGIGYTRNGNFTTDSNGFLSTMDGAKVFGRDGFIKLSGPNAVTISSDGEVIQDKESRGFLKISDFKKPYALTREGNSILKPYGLENEPVVAAGWVVKQGFLEGSNANPIKNMVQMINSYRNYEADQKAMLAQDESMDKAVNVVGKI